MAFSAGSLFSAHGHSPGFRGVRQHRIWQKRRSLVALLWMAAILSAVVGAMRREPPFDAVLNQWDEMMAYSALCSLVIGFI
ncbi:hypothetical protein [Bradyrhizobium valentinum]|uniref:hypothetical protein n=1 Tax=Bradyrhizobium valentinum TaxID=1518501 RepID=UPI000B1FFE2A